MSTAPALPTRASPARVAAAPGRLPRPSLPAVLVGLAVALGVLARVHSPSELWLDEALSVGISRRPLPELFAALKRDGSPPLYYLLLHAWLAVFGDSDNAVRALSTVFSVAALPLVWCAGRRLGGTPVATAALLLLATSPFAVRYATETRMYALVQLLCVAGLFAVLRALERPSATRLLPVAVFSGLLALTHYWALFLLAATAALLAWLAVRGAVAGRRPARRVLAAMAAGGVLFVPWLPTFAFQVRRTGTPWAPLPHLVDIWYSVTSWAGGGNGPAVLLSLLLVALALLALVGRAGEASSGLDDEAPGRALLTLSTTLDRRALALLAGSVGTLALGLLVGMAVAAGYAPRYSSAAVVPGLLLAALGVRVLPARLGAAVLVLLALTGLDNALPQLDSTRRTQAGVTAAMIRPSLARGDVVAYCPDQLGPAVSRLLPTDTDQVVYPSFGAPELVDWVDYAQRNASADPQAYGRALAARTSGAVWLVSAGGYLTFGRQCDELADELAQLRGPGLIVVRQSGSFDEQQKVTRFERTTTAAS